MLLYKPAIRSNFLRQYVNVFSLQLKRIKLIWFHREKKVILKIECKHNLKEFYLERLEGTTEIYKEIMLAIKHMPGA